MDRNVLVAAVSGCLSKTAGVEGVLGFLRGRAAKKEGIPLSSTVTQNTALATGFNAALAFGVYRALTAMAERGMLSKLDPRTALIAGALYAGAGGLEAAMGTIAGHAISAPLQQRILHKREDMP